MENISQNYSSVRKDIADGDLIAWKGTGIGASIIKSWTDSEFTHVGIACWWGPRLMVLESYPGVGTRAHPLSHDLEGAHWFQTGIDFSNVQGFALDLLDLKYSWRNDIRVAFGMNLIETRKQCAQYCRDIFTKAGLKNLPDHPTPANMVSYFVGSTETDITLELTNR